MMNVAKNATGTSALYVVSTSHNWPMITRILLASARNSAATVPPAVVGRETVYTTENTTSAVMLTMPPSTADSAACPPPHTSATAAMATLTIACQRRTRRIAGVDSGACALMEPARGPLKAFTPHARASKQTQRFYYK